MLLLYKTIVENSRKNLIYVISLGTSMNLVYLRQGQLSRASMLVLDLKMQLSNPKEWRGNVIAKRVCCFHVEVIKLKTYSGKAAYGSAVTLIKNDENLEDVGATYFMYYHTVLRTSTDYIEAYRHSLDIADNITNTIKAAIPNANYSAFPYRLLY